MDESEQIRVTRKQAARASALTPPGLVNNIEQMVQAVQQANYSQMFSAEMKAAAEQALEMWRSSAHLSRMSEGILTA